MTHNILLLPGDGIGPEVVGAAAQVVAKLNQLGWTDIKTTTGLIGGASIDTHGEPLTDDTLKLAMQADAVLLGAVGGPRWDKVDYNIRPEAGLLKIRKDMGLFANMRPARVFDALADASTLKTDIVMGLDILLVRELIGGIYFGEPRGIEILPDGQRRGVNTQVYTTSEIHRVARVAFDAARRRNNLLCSVDKANVMESGKLWREEVTALHRAEYPDVQLTHMYGDNCAMQLLRNPRQFDVIVTDNLFGDFLSDEAAMLTGSLGMLPSASFGAADADGRFKALYEPIHGSAPDIAGQDKANPLATILSLAMMLRYSFNLPDVAKRIENAIENVLAQDIRTADIAAPGQNRVGTKRMTDAVLAAL